MTSIRPAKKAIGAVTREVLSRRVHTTAIILALASTCPVVARASETPSPQQATELPAPPKSAAPRIVKVGMYVVQVRDLDLQKNHFVMDLYLWFQWQGDGLQPQKTFEIMNGVIEARDYPKEISYGPSGEFKKASCKLTVQVTKYWDISAYPMDSHPLSLVIEENLGEDSEIRYVPDQANSRLDPDISLPGWKIDGLQLMPATKEYRSNFGETFKPDGQLTSYTRLVATWNLQRTGWGQILKVCSGTIICTFLAFLAFWIRATDLDPRFGLGVGALFALVACQYVIGAGLPDGSVFARADKLNLLSISFVLLSVVLSVCSLRLHYAGNPQNAERLDRAAFWVFLSTYCTLSAVILTWA